MEHEFSTVAEVELILFETVSQSYSHLAPLPFDNMIRIVSKWSLECIMMI